MRKFRTLDAVEADYLRDHPDEMEEYMSVIFEEYARDGNTGALLASLRTMSKVKGITTTAQEAGLSRKGLQKALSEKGNPKFESINAIMHALGYRLSPRKLDMTAAK